MSRSLDDPNWNEGQGFHYDYDSLVPLFSPSTHMPSPSSRCQWAENTGIESRHMQSAHGFIPSSCDPIVSMIGESPWGMLPMAYGSNRATATSAGAPNQHITSNPRYTPSVNEGAFTAIDCTVASAADAGQYGPTPEVCHTVGRAMPPRFGQHRVIQKRSDAHKQSSKASAKYPMKCKWEGCAYPGSFKQESSLIRHLRNFHFAPLAHPCPFDNCDKVCNRGDNLTQHIRNHHHCH